MAYKKSFAKSKGFTPKKRNYSNSYNFQNSASKKSHYKQAKKKTNYQSKNNDVRISNYNSPKKKSNARRWLPWVIALLALIFTFTLASIIPGFLDNIIGFVTAAGSSIVGIFGLFTGKDSNSSAPDVSSEEDRILFRQACNYASYAGHKCDLSYEEVQQNAIEHFNEAKRDPEFRDYLLHWDA